MKIQMLKTEKGLTPLYNSGYEKYGKLKIGWEGEVEFKQPRNYQFHKKFFSLIALAYDNQEKYNNHDHYRKYMIIKSGFYTAYEMDGWTHKEADSISFAAMDQIQFEKVYSRMLDTVIAELGSTKEDILDQVINFM